MNFVKESEHFLKIKQDNYLELYWYKLKETYPSIIIYGAGTHTEKWLRLAIGKPGPKIVAILDKEPRVASLYGIPVKTPYWRPAKRVDAVIVSSDRNHIENELAHDAYLWAEDKGIPVLRIYYDSALIQNHNEAELDYQSRLLKELFYSFFEFQTKNTDFLQYPVNLLKIFVNKLKEIFFSAVKTVNFVYIPPYEVEKSWLKMQEILNQIDGLEEFFRLLNDERSRQLMIKLLIFKILGNQRVKLPTNNSDYWKYLNILKKTVSTPPKGFPLECKFGIYKLKFFNLKKIGFPICLYAIPGGILNEFLLQQYKYENNNKVDGVKDGDVIIDAGGGIGDTALSFAYESGKKGKVFSLEFVPSGLEIMQKNLNLNLSLKERIKVIRKGVWNKSGETISYYDTGPSSSFFRKKMNKEVLNVQTITIDDLVEEEGINRVDFIKMDIEGSELQALQGAEKTIRKFRPKLAIAIYHNNDDFVVIPNYLKKLGLNYKFYLGHKNIHQYETVLFATSIS